MKLLDLFCCAGGGAKGYHDAGFEVTGIDIVKMDRYPYEFIQGDVMEILEDEEFVKNFDAIHASPPCQFYTKLKHLSGDVQKWEENHVDLVAPVREKLKYYNKKYGIPYIIENVQGAPLENPITLYGSQFPRMFTQRPRLFESSIELKVPDEPRRNMKTGKLGTIGEEGCVSVCGRQPLKGLNETQTKLYYGIALGGIDWMSLEELTQCIPPCYTEFLGKQLMTFIKLGESKKEEIKSESDTSTFDYDAFVKLVMSYL